MSHFRTDCQFSKGLLAKTDLDDTSQTLKAISHPLRLQILCQLGTNESSVQDLVSAVGTSQSNISQHLSIMRDKGVLSSRKEANRVFYRIEHRTVLNLISQAQA